MSEYLKRIADQMLTDKLESSGAVLIDTDNFTDLTLDVIGESIDGLMGLVGQPAFSVLFQWEPRMNMSYT